MTNKFVVEVLEQRRDNIVRAEPNFELQLRKNVKSLLNAGGQVRVSLGRLLLRQLKVSRIFRFCIQSCIRD